jgi:cation:H+ antiporter
MLLPAGALLVSLLVLTWSAERFVFGAAATARALGVAPLIIGVTIVGFGTSAPELLISAFAAWQGNAGLAIGNALGSNITNIALILGVTALITPLVVASRTLRRELPVPLLCALLASALLWDRNLDVLDGSLLLLALAVVLVGFVRAAMSATRPDVLETEMEAELAEPVPLTRALLWLLVSLTLLLLSARALVWGAVSIAQTLGVSDLVIGLTVVAIGTSLPELAASVASVLKQEHDIALGNVIGSNIFNLLVLALPGLMHPGSVPDAVVERDMPVVLLLSVALVVMAYGGRQRPGRINRLEGAVLLGAFVGYQYLLIRQV